MFHRNRLLFVTVLLMVGLAIFGQIVRLLITRDVSQFAVASREMDKLLAQAKTDDPIGTSITVKDQNGQTAFDSTRLDKEQFLEMSAKSQQIFDRITLKENLLRGTFATQAVLAVPLVIAIYRATTTTILLGLATRMTSLFTLPLAVLFAGSSVFDLPPNMAGSLQQLSVLGKWGYPLSWLFSLLLLRKHLTNRMSIGQLEAPM